MHLSLFKYFKITLSSVSILCLLGTSQVDEFFEYAVNVSLVYRSNNIAITMGDDFHYQSARMWFENLDKLIL